MLCVVYLRCPKDAIVRLISYNAPFGGVQVVGDKSIIRKSVPLCYSWGGGGGEAVFEVVEEGGYLSVFVWVTGSCLAVSVLEVLVGIDV